MTATASAYIVSAILVSLSFGKQLNAVLTSRSAHIIMRMQICVKSEINMVFI